MEAKKATPGVRELARRVNRSAGHVSRVLRGERKPGRELAAVLRDMGFKVEGA